LTGLLLDGLFLADALFGDDLEGDCLKGLDPLIGEDSLTSLPTRVF